MVSISQKFFGLNRIKTLLLLPKNSFTLTDIRKFIIIFYFVGVVGFAVPITYNFFLQINPLAILLGIYLLIVYHEKMCYKDLILFLLVILSSFFIEVIGVKTGVIFGNYQYGTALGMKIFDTPLLIGFNWLFLTYISNSIAQKITYNKYLVLLLAPTLMLIYDIVLEGVAPHLKMWYWEYDVVPIRNYIAWWILGFLFNILFTLFKINTNNPVTLILYIGQFVFISFLNLLYSYIK